MEYPGLIEWKIIAVYSNNRQLRIVRIEKLRSSVVLLVPEDMGRKCHLVCVPLSVLSRLTMLKTKRFSDMALSENLFVSRRWELRVNFAAITAIATSIMAVVMSIPIITKIHKNIKNSYGKGKLKLKKKNQKMKKRINILQIKL